MRLYRPWIFAPVLYPGAIFRIRTEEKILLLTFDDGPDPCVTPEVLEIIEKHKIKAVFFCNGSASADYPELITRIKSGGHVIGNHGFRHLNGFLTPSTEYIKNTEQADELTSAVLFRPPYGKMRPSQYNKIRKKYRIMMWDLMTYDFDNSLGKVAALELIKKKIRPGSIIVLHDKKGSIVTGYLDDFIRYCVSEGYGFIIPALNGEQAE
jgi:peptidoglycan-N-acetylglucosamine deacetylase